MTFLSFRDTYLIVEASTETLITFLPGDGMTIFYVIVPVAILLVLFFVFAFLWAVNEEQFDDLETPAHRILLDDWYGKVRNTKLKG